MTAVIPVSQIPPKEARWVMPGYIPRGGITLAAGPKGIGKTSLAHWIAAGASRGDALFGGRPLRVFADTCEDDPEVVLRPRLEAAGADLDRIKTREPGRPTWKFSGDYNSHAPLENLLIRAKNDGEPFDLIVLDSLSGYVPRFTNPEVSAATFERLTQKLRDYDCGLVFIHHFNKSGATVDSAIGGAGALTRLARAVYIFGEDPCEEHDPPRLALACEKLNLAPKPPALTFVSTAVEIPAVESVHRLELVEECSECTAQTVFQLFRRGRPDDDGRATEVESAVTWVLEYLADGPQPSRGMVAEAKANGISGRTLERARANVKCQPIHPKRLRERLGDEAYDALPDDQKSAWWVALPALPDAPPEEWSA